ncbi:MAG: hypothetical protein EHM19_01435 [Candidatus Latescibacterota bacterium]|nr:MAG: hypothetical protein EHM19_01435 [Candidatus Latescibacterota bacterium]
MKAQAVRQLPILAFFVLIGLCLAAGAAEAQWDGKASKPPVYGAGTPPQDHGGGDPDNPVPVDGGGGSESFQSEGIQAHPLLFDAGEDSSFGRSLVLLLSTITGVLDSVLFL